MGLIRSIRRTCYDVVSCASTAKSQWNQVKLVSKPTGIKTIAPQDFHANTATLLLDPRLSFSEWYVTAFCNVDVIFHMYIDQKIGLESRMERRAYTEACLHRVFNFICKLCYMKRLLKCYWNNFLMRGIMKKKEKIVKNACEMFINRICFLQEGNANTWQTERSITTLWNLPSQHACLDIRKHLSE